MLRFFILTFISTVNLNRSQTFNPLFPASADIIWQMDLSSEKIFLLIALALPAMAGAFTVWLTTTRRCENKALFQRVETNRALVQIIVQIISAILGALQTFAIARIINFGVNIRMQSRAASLDTLKFWQAVTFGRSDFHLPVKTLVISLVWFILSRIPSAFWAGSITPVVVTADVQATFQLPNYDQTTSGYWATKCPPATSCDYLLGNTSELGTFTYVAWKSELICSNYALCLY